MTEKNDTSDVDDAEETTETTPTTSTEVPKERETGVPGSLPPGETTKQPTAVEPDQHIPLPGRIPPSLNVEAPDEPSEEVPVVTDPPPQVWTSDPHSPDEGAPQFQNIHVGLLATFEFKKEDPTYVDERTKEEKTADELSISALLGSLDAVIIARETLLGLSESKFHAVSSVKAWNGTTWLVELLADDGCLAKVFVNAEHKSSGSVNIERVSMAKAPVAISIGGRENF